MKTQKKRSPFKYLKQTNFYFNLNVTKSLQHCNNHTIYVNNLGSQNVLEVNEPVLIVRPDDGQIGPKYVALNALLMVIIDVLDENINPL